MKKLIEINEFMELLELTLQWDMDGIYTFSNNVLLIQFINPNIGTDFKYIIKAEFKEFFNRWSNCFYEKCFDDVEENLTVIISDLNKMMQEKNKILKEVEKENGEKYFEITDYGKTEWKSSIN